MKILLVHNAYRSGSPGGEDRVFDTERDLLRAAGHQVAVYRRSNDEVFGPSVKDRLLAGASLLSQRFVERAISVLIKDFKPDVAHFHNLFPLIGTAGYAAASKHAVPVVQTIHNYRWSCAAATHFYRNSVCTQCTPQRFRDAVTRRCYRDSSLGSWAVGHAGERIWRRWQDPTIVRRFIALTSFMAARLVEAGISAERVYVKPNCVSTSVRCSDVSKQDYVVYSGRLSVEKGLLTLFHAWRQLPQIPLKVIGDGPLRAELEAVVRQYHLPIQLLGYLPPLEAQKIVAAAKLQVVPSQWFEGMPLVVLEAWSLGTTVLASRIGGLGEMISDGVDGVLFKPGNSADLASQVQLLMSDSELRARLARAARDAVETRFSSHATLDSLTQVYSDVVRR